MLAILVPESEDVGVAVVRNLSPAILLEQPEHLLEGGAAQPALLESVAHEGERVEVLREWPGYE